MFKLRSPPSAPYIYAQQLVCRGHGLPLWFPDQTQADIGDVGFIDHGCFYRIFNAMRPRDDPVNALGFPTDFAPLRLTDTFVHSNDQYLPAGPICADSTTVQKVKIGVSATGYD